MTKIILYNDLNEALNNVENSEDIIFINKEDTINYLGINAIYYISLKLKDIYPDCSCWVNVSDKAVCAIDALKIGFKNIIFTGDQASLDKLKSIAAKFEATIRENMYNKL